MIGNRGEQGAVEEGPGLYVPGLDRAIFDFVSCSFLGDTLFLACCISHKLRAHEHFLVYIRSAFDRWLERRSKPR